MTHTSSKHCYVSITSALVDVILTRLRHAAICKNRVSSKDKKEGHRLCGYCKMSMYVSNELVSYRKLHISRVGSSTVDAGPKHNIEIHEALRQPSDGIILSVKLCDPLGILHASNYFVWIFLVIWTV